MFRRIIISTGLSSLMIFLCLLFLDLFGTTPQDTEIKLVISLMIGIFSYWLVWHRSR